MLKKIISTAPDRLYHLDNRVLNNESLTNTDLRLCRERLASLERMLSKSNFSRIDHPDPAHLRQYLASLIEKYKMTIPITIHHQAHKELPFELWQHIFLDVARFYYPLTLDRPGPIRMLLRLSQVCQLWRRMALRTPNIWRTLKLEFSTYDRSPQSRLDLAKTFLSRAESLPLELFLDARPPLEAPKLSFVQDLIVPFSGTIQSLHVLLDIPLIQELLSLPADSLKNLTTLTLHTINSVSFPKDPMYWKNSQPEWPGESSVTVFTRSSPLKSLYMSPNVPPAKFLGECEILHLEVLHARAMLRDHVWHQLLQLRSCQSISNLRIAVIITDERIAKDIELLLLTDLHVVFNAKDTGPFLDPLVLPSLRLLSIVGNGKLTLSTYEALQRRSGCQIQHLELGDLDSHDVEPLLRATPTLQIFRLHGVTQIDSEVLRMIGRNEIGIALQNFILERGRHSVVDFLVMLETREELNLTLDQDGTSLSPLKEVKMASALERKTDDLLDRIRRLRDIGVSLVVNWPFQ